MIIYKINLNINCRKHIGRRDFITSLYMTLMLWLVDQLFPCTNKEVLRREYSCIFNRGKIRARIFRCRLLVVLIMWLLFQYSTTIWAEKHWLLVQRFNYVFNLKYPNGQKESKLGSVSNFNNLYKPLFHRDRSETN